MFINFEKGNTGSLIFRGDDKNKILGNGTNTLGNKDTEEKNVSLIENMKHNLLSVSQMCDQGHILFFNSK